MLRVCFGMDVSFEAPLCMKSWKLGSGDHQLSYSILIGTLLSETWSITRTASMMHWTRTAMHKGAAKWAYEYRRVVRECCQWVWLSLRSASHKRISCNGLAALVPSAPISMALLSGGFQRLGHLLAECDVSPHT